MKHYSDTLTRDDFETATNVVAGLGLEEFEPLPKPRLRARGWNVLLFRSGSNRPFNSGRFGADGQGAASRADWGWFLAALFERDPEMIAGPYRGKDDFHTQTDYQFESTAQGGNSNLAPPPPARGEPDFYTLTVTIKMTAAQRIAYAAEYGLDDGHGRPVTPEIHFAVRSDVQAHLRDEISAKVGEVYLIREFTSYSVSDPA